MSLSAIPILTLADRCCSARRSSVAIIPAGPVTPREHARIAPPVGPGARLGFPAAKHGHRIAHGRRLALADLGPPRPPCHVQKVTSRVRAAIFPEPEGRG